MQTSMESPVMSKPFLSNAELIDTALNKVPVMCSGVRGTLCFIKNGTILFDADEV